MRGNCMADYHPEHNATLAFMYGPLVLAGINVTSDIWIPRGGTVAAKQNPASFISRVQPAGDSKHALSFKATAQVRCFAATFTVVARLRFASDPTSPSH
eukprot:COSAG01_NODE_1350_length_10605_cov_43.649743_7_plen_99_part_00